MKNSTKKNKAPTVDICHARPGQSQKLRQTVMERRSDTQGGLGPVSAYLQTKEILEKAVEKVKVQRGTAEGWS